MSWSGWSGFAGLPAACGGCGWRVHSCWGVEFWGWKRCRPQAAVAECAQLRARRKRPRGNTKLLEEEGVLILPNYMPSSQSPVWCVVCVRGMVVCLRHVTAGQLPLPFLLLLFLFLKLRSRSLVLGRPPHAPHGRLGGCTESTRSSRIPSTTPCGTRAVSPPPTRFDTVAPHHLHPTHPFPHPHNNRNNALALHRLAGGGHDACRHHHHHHAVCGARAAAATGTKYVLESLTPHPPTYCTPPRAHPTQPNPFLPHTYRLHALHRRPRGAGLHV